MFPQIFCVSSVSVSPSSMFSPPGVVAAPAKLFPVSDSGGRSEAVGGPDLRFCLHLHTERKHFRLVTSFGVGAH